MDVDKMEGYPATPELDKLTEVQDTFIKLNQFLEWLDEKLLTIAEYNAGDWSVRGGLTSYRNQDNLPYEFLDIDPNVIEKERRAILTFLREFNERTANE